jgi:hypothetical protein
MHARKASFLMVAVVAGSLAFMPPAMAENGSCVGQYARAGEVPGADAREIRGPGLGGVVRQVAGAHHDCGSVLPTAP